MIVAQKYSPNGILDQDSIAETLRPGLRKKFYRSEGSGSYSRSYPLFTNARAFSNVGGNSGMM